MSGTRIPKNKCSGREQLQILRDGRWIDSEGYYCLSVGDIYRIFPSRVKRVCMSEPEGRLVTIGDRERMVWHIHTERHPPPSNESAGDLLDDEIPF